MFTKLLDGIFVLVFSVLKRHHRGERSEKCLKHMSYNNSCTHFINRSEQTIEYKDISE